MALINENFQQFDGSGFAPNPSTGQLDSNLWRITGLSDGEGVFGSTHDSGDFARGIEPNGGSSTGGVYAFKVGDNFILGIQPDESDFTPGAITLKLTNTTGSTLTTLSVAYDIFHNNNEERSSSLNFAYSIGDESNYLNVSDLAFATLEASDSLEFQSVSRATTITNLSLAPGANLYLQWQSDDVSGSNSRDEIGIDNVVVECFLAGTRILSDRGLIPVEDLAIGDLVLTSEGNAEPIKWIGRQTVVPQRAKNPLRSHPILIKAGALGETLPHHDLYVSPDHALRVEGLLINAGALVNHRSILKTTPTQPFTYYHVELHRHALLVAEGVAAESYLPQREDRLGYDNGAEYTQLYPKHDILAYWPMRYPRVSSKRQLPRFVSQRLWAIANQLESTATACQP
ncbi:MAG: Hint domain-containing protein [Leptolyngbyaceae cyanobacterium]